MNEREKLIELIVSADISLFGSDKPYAEVYADHLLANGVIVPPCKVGDTLYFIPKYLKDWLYDDVEYIKIYEDHFLIKTVDDYYFEEDDFGKTVFLSREAAEKALKEIKK